jgi:ABC-type Zn uptake system ZnuABC Zn-binding protein ZnuA
MRSCSDLLGLVVCSLVLSIVTSGCQGTAGPQVVGNANEPVYHGDQVPSLSPLQLSADEKLKVVATTSIVADVVENTAGDRVELSALMPLGTDPHSFEPTPQDAAALADADVIFVNGAGLELFLESLLASAGEDVPVVPVSFGFDLLRFAPPGEHGEEEPVGHADFDPHTWFDPHNVMVWVANIEAALTTLDPGNADVYEVYAERYRSELDRLDEWIRGQVAQVPQQRRKLVTDHMSLGYFTRRYGFEQLGAVFPGYSTLTEPSAQQLARLEDAIREFDVTAVFVGRTVNPNLAQRVAEDTGTQVVFLYTGSLSEPGGPADTYLGLMRYNVSAIVGALK